MDVSVKTHMGIIIFTQTVLDREIGQVNTRQSDSTLTYNKPWESPKKISLTLNTLVSKSLASTETVISLVGWLLFWGEGMKVRYFHFLLSF